MTDGTTYLFQLCIIPPPKSGFIRPWERAEWPPVQCRPDLLFANTRIGCHFAEKHSSSFCSVCHFTLRVPALHHVSPLHTYGYSNSVTFELISIPFNLLVIVETINSLILGVWQIPFCVSLFCRSFLNSVLFYIDIIQSACDDAYSSSCILAFVVESASRIIYLFPAKQHRSVSTPSPSCATFLSQQRSSIPGPGVCSKPCAGRITMNGCQFHVIFAKKRARESARRPIYSYIRGTR